MVDEGTPLKGTTADGTAFVGYTYYEGDEMWISCVDEDGDTFTTPLALVDDWRVIH